MQLWDFQPWLAERLAAREMIADVRTFEAADAGATYGLVVRSVHGVTVLIHLTRGSGTHDKRVLPPEHHANVARVGDRTFEPKPLADATSTVLERILDRLLLDDSPPGFVCAVTSHDRQAMRAKSARVQPPRGAAKRAGLVVMFNDLSEVYVNLHG